MSHYPIPHSYGFTVTHAGALVNARDHRKRTPLHVAAEEGEEGVIAVLLEKKADVNVTDLDGNTPLDLAAKKQHKDAVDLILTHSFCPRKDDAVKQTLERAMNPDGTVRDDFVKDKIGELSPFRYALALDKGMLVVLFVQIAPSTCIPFPLASTVSPVCSSLRNVVVRGSTSSSSTLSKNQSSR